jgi:alkylation response protein AidB-like acyl-CoA dehydrogenase
MGDVLDGAIIGNATTELGTEDVGGRTFVTTLDALVLTGTKYPCTAASTRTSCPSSPPPGDPLPASTVDGVADAELTEAASLRAAQAKVAVEEIAFRATTQLFEIGGASATKREHDLDRHWRNARTIASHNPTI